MTQHHGLKMTQDFERWCLTNVSMWTLCLIWDWIEDFNSLQNLSIENCPHPDDIDDGLVDDYSLLYQADTEMESISCLHLDDIGDSMLDDYILLHEVHCGKHKLSTVVWFCLGISWRQSTIRKTNITILHWEGPSIPLPHFMEMGCFSRLNILLCYFMGPLNL